MGKYSSPDTGYAYFFGSVMYENTFPSPKQITVTRLSARLFPHYLRYKERSVDGTKGYKDNIKKL